MPGEVRLAVKSDSDVEHVRHMARDITEGQGFEPFDQESVVLAVSELATNLVRHVGGGEVVLSTIDDHRGKGLSVESLDHGPGIENLDAAMRDGFSTAKGMGSGLGVVRRQMDELEIATGASGTHIVARKWLKAR